MTIRFSPSQIALLMFCALLITIFVYQVAAPLPEFDIPVSSSPITVPPLLLGNTSHLPSLDAFADITAHPLFIRSRQPVQTADNLSTSAQSLQEVILVGAIIDGSNRLALVRLPSAPSAISVSVGSNVGGWTVSDIAADRITLEAAVGERVISLASNTSSQPSLGRSPTRHPNIELGPPDTRNGVAPQSRLETGHELPTAPSRSKGESGQLSNNLLGDAVMPKTDQVN